MATNESHAHGHDDVGHHLPMWLLVVTLLILLVLTFITVASVWWIDLGPAGNLLMAMIIATIKGTLVALFFMHLAYDRPFNAIVLVGSLFFVALFISLALFDSLTYKPNIDAYRAQDPAYYAPELQQP